MHTIGLTQRVIVDHVFILRVDHVFIQDSTVITISFVCSHDNPGDSFFKDSFLKNLRAGNNERCIVGKISSTVDLPTGYFLQNRGLFL